MSNFSSKKFSAAEKHFQKKLDEERKRQNYYEAEAEKLAAQLAEERAKCGELSTEVERLKKIMNISDDERKRLERSADSMEALTVLIKAMNVGGVYGY